MKEVFESIYNESIKLTELKTGFFGIKKDGKVLEQYSLKSQEDAVKKIEELVSVDEELGQKHEYEVIKPSKSKTSYNKFIGLDD